MLPDEGRLDQDNALLRATLNRVCHRTAGLTAENIALRRELARVRGTLVPRTGDAPEFRTIDNSTAFSVSSMIWAAIEDPSPSNPAPDATPVSRRITDVIADIAGGSVTRPDLKRLGDAVDAAVQPSVGREAQNQALGRAIRRNP